MRTVRMIVQYGNGVEFINVEFPLEALLDKKIAKIDKYGYHFIFNLFGEEEVTTPYLEKAAIGADMLDGNHANAFEVKNQAEINKVLDGISDGSIDTSAFEVPLKAIPLTDEELGTKEIKSPNEVKEIIKNFEKAEKHKDKASDKAIYDETNNNKIDAAEIIDEVVRDTPPAS